MDTQLNEMIDIAKSVLDTSKKAIYYNNLVNNLVNYYIYIYREANKPSIDKHNALYYQEFEYGETNQNIIDYVNSLQVVCEELHCSENCSCKFITLLIKYTN